MSKRKQYNHSMPRCIIYFIFVLAAVIVSTPTSATRAESVNLPTGADSAYDLINAVNVLRASNGLPSYSINSILMYTAQAQADFMAATGNVTHTGPGGIGLTDRLLAAGYSLAGDLSAGGFRAENITSGGENSSAQSAVNDWTGDATHLNTMLSPNLTEIGAGVSVANGRVYYVIDCARPTTNEGAQGSAPVAGSGSGVPASEANVAPIPVALVSTPNSNGDVIHEVKSGQSLWQIAIAYEVKIDDIKRLNNLLDNNIYPGDKLLIKKDVVLPITSLPETPTSEATASPTLALTSMATALQATLTSTPTIAASISLTDNTKGMGMVIGILALAVLGGGIFAWHGSSRKE